eukprot:2829703-Rhodomonas_salina.1
MRGTELAYGGAVCGTEIAAEMGLCGTEIAYGACKVDVTKKTALITMFLFKEAAYAVTRMDVRNHYQVPRMLSISLRARYAMSGTDLAYGATSSCS